MSMIIEQSSIPGYIKAPDTFQVHIRLSVHHRGRIWVLGCSAKNDTQEDSLLDTEVRSVELASLVFALFLHRGRANWKRATIHFRNLWYQLKMAFLHRGRL